MFLYKIIVNFILRKIFFTKMSSNLSLIPSFELNSNHCVVYEHNHVFKFADNLDQNNTLIIQPIDMAPYLTLL